MLSQIIQALGLLLKQLHGLEKRLRPLGLGGELLDHAGGVEAVGIYR